MKRSERKLKKRKEAQERQELRDSRSPQEQLVFLDKKLGKDAGAVKERKKLNTLIKEGSANES